MRRVWRAVWLWLAGVLFLGAPLFFHAPRAGVWQGATLGWSPIATVGAVEANDTWDVEGWLRNGAREYHGALRDVEEGLWFSLDVLLRDVYEWRDSA